MRYTYQPQPCCTYRVLWRPRLPRDWRFLAGHVKEHVTAFRRTPEYKAWLDCFRRLVACQEGGDESTDSLH